MGSSDLHEHLHAIRERARRTGERVHAQMDWVDERRRALWDRMDGLADRSAAPGDAARSPERPVAVSIQMHAEQAELDREARATETRAEAILPESERKWLRGEVERMRRGGWSWEELADIGFGPELIAALGLRPPPPAVAPAPRDARPERARAG